MRYQTNSELANDWYRLANSVGTNLADRSFRDKIASSDVNIPEYFEQHGNLDDLKVKGVGAKTKYQMSLLFEKGLDEARKELSEQRTAQERDANKWVGRRDKAGKIGETSGSWDNVVRRTEE